jgi:hypothetical protein
LTVTPFLKMWIVDPPAEQLRHVIADDLDISGTRPSIVGSAPRASRFACCFR